MIEPLDFKQLRWENPNLTEWQLTEREQELMAEKINELVSAVNEKELSDYNLPSGTNAVFVRQGDLFGPGSEEVYKVENNRICTASHVYCVEYASVHNAPDGCVAIRSGDKVDGHIITKITNDPFHDSSFILYTKDLEVDEDFGDRYLVMFRLEKGQRG